jgi:methyl-galactoside transport system ATP-binding protein/inositol transport system ATP-binding protein
VSEYLLEMKNIVKLFPGVQALKGVELKVRYGEIHSLMGENGAGKSTLMKCIAGIYMPTSGEIVFEGKVQEPYNPSLALAMGISMIHQELTPVLHRPIMENVWLGREPLTKLGLVDHKKMYAGTKELLKEIELDEDPLTPMVNLTVAKMQMVEIAKAVSYNSKLIIMDEPTSALAEKEIKQLFAIMRKLKSQGKSIIFISHKLDEIFEIADQVTVYRDGNYIGTEKAKDLPVDKLIKMMVGRDVNELFPKIVCPIGDVKLEVKNLSNSKYFKDVSFTVRKGEILGIAGLVGAQPRAQTICRRRRRRRASSPPSPPARAADRPTTIVMPRITAEKSVASISISTPAAAPAAPAPLASPAVRTALSAPSGGRKALVPAGAKTAMPIPRIGRTGLSALYPRRSSS